MAVLNVRCTGTLCQNEVQNLFQTATVVFAQQFVAVHANHGAGADVAGGAVTDGFLANTGSKVQTSMLLGIQNGFLTDLQLLGIFGGTERLIITCFESNIPNALFQPFSLGRIPLAEIRQLRELAFLEEQFRAVIDEHIRHRGWVCIRGDSSCRRNGRISCVVDDGHFCILLFKNKFCSITQKSGLPKTRKSALKAKC